MKEVYQVNVFSQVFLMQMATRKMMRQRSGCIINMCSVGGIETSPGYLAYGSSKASLIWITKSVARELGQYNIRVNGIAPGLIDTDMGNYKSEEELLFGKPRRVERDGFYIQTPHACESKAFVKEFNGVKLDKYTVYYTWERLGCHGEIPDGLMAWKELDVPEEKNSCKD